MTPIVKRLALLVAFLAATDLAILVDIPVLRQLLGFSFFTVVPGLLLLYLLRLGRLGLTERIVLSVGLSVSFLMLYGLFVNSTSRLFGYDTPLSTVSLVVSLSLAVLAMAVIAYRRNRTASLSGLSAFLPSTEEKAYLLLPALFPLLSIIGARLMNSTGNNILLMTLLFLIPAYIIFVSTRRAMPERIYPALIFFIGISLMLTFALRSNHILGSDSHLEYYLFQATSDSSYWSITGFGNLDACLSISLLPSSYQSLLSIDPEYLFKVLYALILSIGPLAAYVLAKKYVGGFYAFLASFFVMSQVVFVWTSAHARANLGVLFFILTIMAIFHDGVSEFGKKVLFVVFAASILVSHYSTSYVFLFILLLTWLGMQVLSLIFSSKVKTLASPVRARLGLNPGGDGSAVGDPAYQSALSKKNVTITLLTVFFVMLFLWYGEVIRAPFTAGVSFLRDTLLSLDDFFLLEARSEQVRLALGESALTKGWAQQVKLVLNWATVLLIAIGVLNTLRRLRGVVSASGDKKTGLLAGRLDAEFLMLAAACSGLLVLSLVLPYVSTGYALGREKFQAIAVLSVFLVIGGMTVARTLRLSPRLLMVLILVPYFLGTTGVLYQISGVQDAVTLNTEGSLYYDIMYVHDQESRAAVWLKGESEEGTAIHADGWNRRLVSQGGISESRIDGDLASIFETGGATNHYIYLRYQNVAKGELHSEGETQPIEEFPLTLDGRNKIYASNGSEVYR